MISAPKSVHDEKVTLISHRLYNLHICKEKLTELRWDDIWILFVTNSVSDIGRPQVLASLR